MMWYWGTGVHGWAWGLGIFSSLIFWGLIVWAIVALVSWGRRGRPGARGPVWQENGSWPGKGPHGPASPWHDNDPEQILSRRYAAGEIDAEEYRQRLEVLRAQRYGAGAGTGPGAGSS